MNTKSITDKSFKELMNLSDLKLDRRLEWLNHIGAAYAYEVAGRLHYDLSVKIGRNISERLTVRYTVPMTGKYRKALEIVKG